MQIESFADRFLAVSTRYFLFVELLLLFKSMLKYLLKSIFNKYKDYFLSINKILFNFSYLNESRLYNS